MVFLYFAENCSRQPEMFETSNRIGFSHEASRRKNCTYWFHVTMILNTIVVLKSLKFLFVAGMTYFLHYILMSSSFPDYDYHYHCHTLDLIISRLWWWPSSSYIKNHYMLMIDRILWSGEGVADHIGAFYSTHKCHNSSQVNIMMIFILLWC